MPIKVAKESIVQHMGTIPDWLGLAWLGLTFWAKFLWFDTIFGKFFLACIKDSARNIPLKFDQNRVSNSSDTPNMDKSRQDKCCLDKCHRDR